MKKFLIVIAMALPLLSGCFIHHHDRDDGYHRGHRDRGHDHHRDRGHDHRDYR